MLFKQRATHIAVETEGEVLINVNNALFKVLCGTRGVGREGKQE